jgi:hypothetical protein
VCLLRRRASSSSLAHSDLGRFAAFPPETATYPFSIDNDNKGRDQTHRHRAASGNWGWPGCSCIKGHIRLPDCRSYYHRQRSDNQCCIYLLDMAAPGSCSAVQGQHSRAPPAGSGPKGLSPPRCTTNSNPNTPVPSHTSILSAAPRWTPQRHGSHRASLLPA